jgi:hypothetical protein
VAAEKNTAQEDARIAISATNAARTSGSGSGSSKATNDPNSMGTPAQVTAYYDYLNIFGGGGNGAYAGDLAGAATKITNNRGEIEAAIGTPLYTKLVADIKALDTVVGAPAKAPAPEKPVAYTIPDAIKELTTIVNPQYDKYGKMTAAPGVASAYTRLNQMADAGMIDEVAYDALIASTPGLKAYVDSVNTSSNAANTAAYGQAYSQSRFD